MVTEVTPTTVTPGTTGSWVDVDVSSYVDSGNTAGVILRVYNTDASQNFQSWGVRMNGSTDGLYNAWSETEGHLYAFVGVDDNDVFEAQIENTEIVMDIVGYIVDSNATFQTNATDITPSTTDSWTDVDVSGTASSGASLAFCALEVETSSDGFSNIGFRPNGSTDDFKAPSGEEVLDNTLHHFHVNLDSNQIFEAFIDFTSDKMYLTGWYTGDFTTFTNGVLYSIGSTGTWVDTDISGDLITGADDAFGVLWDDSITSNSGIRKNGSSYDAQADITVPRAVWSATDGNQVIEQYKGDSGFNGFYLTGFSAQLDDPPGFIRQTKTGNIVETKSGSIQKTN